MDRPTLRDLRRQLSRRSGVQREVERSVDLAPPPRQPRQPGSVWGVSVVRDEADIVGATVEHFLAQGLSGVLVLDHRSEDGTLDVLRDLAARHPGRVHVGRTNAEAFHQGRLQSYLAHLAHRAGADWVLPFDADEWWYAPGLPLAVYLGRQRADVATAAMHTARPAREGFAVGDPVRVDRAPGARRKAAFRTREWVWVYDGNHEVDLPGERLETLSLLHFTYRGLHQLARRVMTGSSSITAGGDHLEEGVAQHWHQLAGLPEGELARRWGRYLAGEDSLPTFGGTGGGQGVVVDDYTGWACWDPQHRLGP